jgi:Pyruvate/2-oxoacid:ferredoxin oxidoreductase gamma subunit
MDKHEFQLPDPDATGGETAVEFEVENDTPEIEVVDDTPAADRNKQPAPPPSEVTDDELEGYSEKVRGRIKHLSRGYHDERRSKEAALREREEAVRLAQQLIEENKRLKGGTDQANSLLLAEAKKTAEHELAAARRAYKEAYEAGDPDRVVDAQEKLTEAKLKAERLASMRPRPQPALQAPETVVQTQQAAPVARDERAAKWKEENSWFGSDDEMTAFALGLHQKLVKSGMNPTSDEYYESINSRMRKVFPEQFGEADLEDEQPKAKPQARSNVVAPATRSTAPKKIVLTQSQVSIAKRLGVSLEDYAKQVALEMRKQNG